MGALGNNGFACLFLLGTPNALLAFGDQGWHSFRLPLGEVGLELGGRREWVDEFVLAFC